MIGQTFGSYQIQRELGRGGMGAVYVGTHALLGRTAAIKVLLPELSKNQEIVQRFFNEARAATAIRHPGIVEVYDFGFTPDGSAYIVMEHLGGESLSARIRRDGPMAPTPALTVARQVAMALAAAHRAGIVHRDLKPDNVFLVPDDEVASGERVKLLDFGIAKLAAEGPGGAMTTTGAVMGTPYYMSPEQCRGAGLVDARSDLYSLGAMLFEMMSGRVPFAGPGTGEIIGAHLHVAPPPLRSVAPDVDPAIEALIARLMAKRPEDRPQSAEQVAQEIGQLGGGVTASRVVSAAAPTMPTVAGKRSAMAPRGRAIWWILGAGVLVAGGVTVGLIATGGGGAAARPDAAVPVAVAPDAAPVVPDAAPVAPDGAPVSHDAEIAAFIDQGKELMYAEKFEAALAAFEHALELDPALELARFDAAVAAFQLGDCTKARGYIKGLTMPKAAAVSQKIEEYCATQGQ